MTVYINGVPTSISDIRTATLVVAADDSVHKNMADYVCDGVNDHIEIQAALDALPATGGEVFLLDGTYNVEVSLVLDSYQTLRGCGSSTILTTTTAALDIITVTGAPGTEKIGILVADLCVDGNAGGVANGVGISWAFADYSSIYNVWSQDNGTYAISLVNCDWNSVENNTCQGNATGILLDTSTNNTVLGNICQGNLNGIMLDTSTNNTVSGNTCQGGSINIRLMVSSNNNTVSGNTCQGATNTGILLNASDGNIISGNISQEALYGIDLVDSHNNTVSKNTCRTNQNSGIDLAGANNNAILGNMTTENSQVFNNIHPGIMLASSSYNNIQGNTCRAGALANKSNYGINISNAACQSNLVTNNDLYDDGFGTASFNDVGTCTIVQDDNRGIAPTQVKHMVYVQNTSGGNLLIGNVVAYEAAAAAVGFHSPTAIGDPMVWGMLAEDIVDTAFGYIQVLGGTVLLDATNVGGGAIVIGDLLCTEVGSRARKAAAGHIVFAIAMEDGDAADLVLNALIIRPRMI